MKDKPLKEKRVQIDEYYIQDYHYKEYDVKETFERIIKRLDPIKDTFAIKIIKEEFGNFK